MTSTTSILLQTQYKLSADLCFSANTKSKWSKQVVTLPTPQHYLL